MKKLMIAAAMVCAAAVAQAATVNWNEATSLTTPDGEANIPQDTLVYLIRTADHSQQSVLDALISAGSASSLASTLSSWKVDSVGLTEDATFDVSGTSSTAFSDKGSETAYFAIISGKNVFLSDVKDADYSEAGGADDYTFGFEAQWGTYDSVYDAKDDGLQDSGAWYTYETEPVPEPFSGVLALVGMGAIALRRKMKKAKRA